VTRALAASERLLASYGPNAGSELCVRCVQCALAPAMGGRGCMKFGWTGGTCTLRETEAFIAGQYYILFTLDGPRFRDA
jgi:hypothetical protein